MRSDIVRNVPNRVPMIARATTEAKRQQDFQTEKLGSEQAATIVRSDPDMLHFLSPALKDMHVVSIGSPNVGVATTLAYMPPSQVAHPLYSPAYDSGTSFSLDRAGSGSNGMSILRPGQPPIGYVSEGVAVQKRFKRYFRKLRAGEDGSDDVTFRFAYDVDVRQEAKGYSLKIDEQYDGGLYDATSNNYLGIEQPYGLSFPVTGDGDFKLNPDPWGDSGWTGAAVNPSGPRPQIDSINPNTISMADVAALYSLEITGANFTDCTWALIGPFHPVQVGSGEYPVIDLPDSGFQQYNTLTVQPDGALFYRFVTGDTIIDILAPADAQPGVWDVIVIGSGGMVGRLEKGLTITE